MSRKNRSKFIAFRLKNNQICKAVFVQYDDAQARQIAAHQPPASHHRHGLDSPGTYPAQGQHPAPVHSRPAPEDSRGTPAPRREGRGRQQHQSPEPAPRRGRVRKTGRGQRPAPAPKEASTATKASRRTEGDPAAPSRCNPPASQTAEPAPPRRWKGEDRETGEKGKRNGQKMTVKERRPACTPDRASAQALRPYCQQSQHTRPENSPGERQRIGESIPLLWSMQNCP